MSKEECKIKLLFNDISKMWVLDILWIIYQGEKSFNGIKSKIKGLSSKVLSERLKELKNKDFIVRKIISEQPIKIEYSLTEKGLSFNYEAEKLNKWANKWY